MGGGGIGFRRGSFEKNPKIGGGEGVPPLTPHEE